MKSRSKTTAMYVHLLSISETWKSVKMARKKQEIALQTMIETQEEWEDMLSKEGLLGFFIILHLIHFSRMTS